MKINERKEFISWFPPTHSVVGKTWAVINYYLEREKKKTVEVEWGATGRHKRSKHTTVGPINFDFFGWLFMLARETPFNKIFLFLSKRFFFCCPPPVHLSDDQSRGHLLKKKLKPRDCHHVDLVIID